LTDILADSPFVKYVYSEIITIDYGAIFLPNESGEQEAVEMVLHDFSGNIDWMSTPVSTSDMHQFLRYNADWYDGQQLLGSVPVGNFAAHFSEGFSADDFVYIPGEPIPVIVHQILHQERLGLFNVPPGSRGVISIVTRVHGDMVLQRLGDIVIIGTYTGGHARGIGRIGGSPHAVILPNEGLRHLVGRSTPYNMVRFYIEPAYNRYIGDFREEMRRTVDAMELVMHINDEHLRIAVGPLEQTLRIMSSLYPVALIVTALLSAGLAVLLIINSAKNAAIMRALGQSKSYTATTAWCEYIFVCAVGLLLSPLPALAFGMGISLLSVIVYIGGAAVGAAVGTFVITNRPPLALLQVRE
jgi:hypothetical protein